MTSRERVLKALNFEEPDRIPVDWGNNTVDGISEIAYRNLLKYLGREEEKIEIVDIDQGLAKPSEYILELFDVDTRSIHPNPPSFWKFEPLEDGSYIDQFGIKRRKVGPYYEPVTHPLANAQSISDLSAYKLCDPMDSARFKGLREQAIWLRENTDKAITAGAHGSLYAMAWDLRGLQQFMIDVASDSTFANYILDMNLDWWKGFMDKYLGEIGDYIDIMWFGDDWGTQLGPIIHPEEFRRNVKPRLKEMISFMKERSNAKLAYHTCGSSAWAFDDLYDAGVDIIQPVQPNAAGMEDSKKLKDMTYGKLILHGGLDNQGKFHLAKEVVIEDVKQKIRDFAPGGGYLFACGHNIQANCPPENIIAIFDTFKKHSSYPISV